MSDLFVHRRRERVDAEMDITPMIDITFLLLIFFLVASKMGQEVGLALPQARNGTAVTEKTSAVVCLTSEEPGPARIYLGGEANQASRVDSTDLSQQDQAVTSYVNQELANGKQQVIIRADKAVHHRDVNRIMQAIGAAQEVSIFVAVLEKD
jgi:biopolymer transport protein ExbD